MITDDDRDRLVMRAWGSFFLALLFVACVGGIYDYFAEGLVVTAPAVALFGIGLAVPFLVAVTAAAYWFAAPILKQPFLWSATAVIATAALAFVLLPKGVWIGALVTSTLAAFIFCTWGIRPFLDGTQSAN